MRMVAQSSSEFGIFPQEFSRYISLLIDNNDKPDNETLEVFQHHIHIFKHHNS